MEKRIACHTLGCKVNQYDTEAMLERFEDAGWQRVGTGEPAEVYLINTCTVTGTGDQKSLKLIRRIHREHPDSAIVVCGCLAQRDAGRVMLPGVKLVVGTKRRADVVSLLEQALAGDGCLCAVDTGGTWSFENLSVSRHEGRTRAVMKIQEGCDRFCSYCVIPYVRGPVRSMPLEAVRGEAERLCLAGYREIVVNGIHLASYGRGEGVTLADALRACAAPESIRRVRLGSLEPTVVTDEFVKELLAIPEICPQFHLSMQSGSEAVLRRMHRRYTPEGYLEAARRLQEAWNPAAVTTDVLTGFPGETYEEALETEAFIEKVGFARIHVFPYSRRAGTLADRMPGQVPESVKQYRAGRLIEIGNRMKDSFVKALLGSTREVLFETALGDGRSEGYTPEFVRVRANGAPGEIRPVRLTGIEDGVLTGEAGAVR